MALRTAVGAAVACVAIGAGVAMAAPQGDPAPPPPARVHTEGDPFEGLNRQLFRLHKGLDRFVVRPVAITYKRVTPRPLRVGLRNVINNLGEPITFVNDVLQLKPKRAGQTVARFAVNSTVGVGGLFDVATAMKVERHEEDFGQTLGRYGAGPGPYIFIPVLGPSSLRDSVGRAVDVVVNPLAIDDLDITAETRTGIAVADGIDTRAQLDPALKEVERTATDEYATLRSAYWQNRKAAIADGQTKVDELPDFDELPTGTTPTDQPEPK